MLHGVPWPAPFPEDHAEVDVAIGRLIELPAGHDLEAKIGMLGLKGADVIAKPHRGKSRGARDAQRPLQGLVRSFLVRIGQNDERFLHILRITLPSGCERDALAAAAHHLEAEDGLEHGDAVADGAAGNPEILRRLPDGAQPLEGIERLQSMQWRNARVHGVRTFHLKNEYFARQSAGTGSYSIHAPTERP